MSRRRDPTIYEFSVDLRTAPTASTGPSAPTQVSLATFVCALSPPNPFESFPIDTYPATAGASANYSVSRTISTSIPPIRITTHRDPDARKQSWDLDFTGVEMSEVARSNFDATFQTLWRFQPAKGTNFYEALKEMDFRLSLHWRPWVQWALGGEDERVLYADDPGKVEYELRFGNIPQKVGAN